MSEPKLGKSSKNRPMHYSVGALIKKYDKYLMIDRAKPPFGFAFVAGHIDKDETPEEALVREVMEESGLKVGNFERIHEEEVEVNTCTKGIDTHYWYLFKCETSGELNQNYLETKSIGWYSIDEIKKLELEPIWAYWLRKLGILEE